MERVSSIRIDLIQQEVHGSVTLKTVDENAPYEVRTLKSYEVIDGCASTGQVVPFRIPLRGLTDLTPTAKNILNNFSVRYYVKLVYNMEVESFNSQS